MSKDDAKMFPPEQQAIRDKCFHPSGNFVEFPIEDVETSIPARFERIVRQHADRIAVKTEACVATYSQLNEMANRFAHYLLQSLVPKAQLVALLLEKDVTQVAAMLGAMKAGKFFLILDPSFPKTRLTAMLKGSRAKLLVTNRRNAGLADEIATPDCRLMQWETIDGSISGNNPELSIAAKALAFINYTSGSTGEPKGLLRNHRMILHNVMLRTNLIHVCEHDRISLLSSGTSNAITNSLLALLNGAGLYSLEVKQQGIVQLSRWLAEERITIAPMSSPLFRNLCETLKGSNNFPDFRALRLRSESVYKSDTDLYKRFFSPTCIFVTGLSSNETGPLADYLIDHDTIVADGAVPIGYAAPGKEIVLVNQDGEEVGSDEVAEIVVRSRYLSPGYLRNPLLTKSKFKRDPSENGSRIYLTGDMGLVLSDGCLVHQGRKDFRVKVRGNPVDIKEVETALRDHPRIHDSVITARINHSGETVLVAYFVTAPQEVPTVSELVRFLGQTLPDYMIPAFFVRLNSIPLNPQNKVDRAALPPPAETRPHLDTPFMAPHGNEETAVAEIWAEVLGIDRVGISDNFFDLGGHSLAATRIVTRLIDKFQLELPPQTFFDTPTVREMAAVIRESRRVIHQPGRPHSQRSRNAVQARPVGPTIGLSPFPNEEVEGSIPEQFEQIVRMFPDRVAIKTGEESVTYTELNIQANRVAQALLTKIGNKPAAVAIVMKTGIPYLTAIIGVLKSGKYFALIDPADPISRITSIVQDAKAELVIADQNSTLIREITNIGCQTIDYSDIGNQLNSHNLSLDIPPDSLAMIVYTSGSTGAPKGVTWNHEALFHRKITRTRESEISESDRIALLSSHAGNTINDVLLALLNGATLLPFDVRAHGVVRLGSWLGTEGVSICAIAAPLFRKLCECLTDAQDFSNLRVVRLRSDTVQAADISLFNKHFPSHCALITGLASSEAGHLTSYRIVGGTDLAGDEVPIGYPVPFKEVLLLDNDGQEVDFGEVGEIAVRSRYLALGYWRRPELTESKFKVDPQDPAKRIYFTGDLGFMRSDGCLMHKGRKDFRVKIRGNGVELDEVERALRSHPAVGEAAVLGRPDGSSEHRLIAYYTARGARHPSVSELREFISEKLPSYMAPSTFIKMATIPLTTRGKIDRRALPDPDSCRPELSTPFVAPRTDVERTIARIFTECTGVEEVSIEDYFFDLGGDSLLLARLVSRLSLAFQREFFVGELFENSSITGIARLLEATEHFTPANEPIPSRNFSDTPPLSFAQQRLWFLDQLDPGSFTYNLFSAYRLEGALNVGALERTFNEIIRRHKVLRTVFKSENGKPAQVILPNLSITMPVFDLRALVSEDDRWIEARRIFTEEAQRPFDLAIGPLLRVTLLQLADDEYVLVRAMHHIVYDGWSEAVLLRELSEIYDALSTGQRSPLSDLPAQYADYAKWQRQWFEGERFESQLSYWKKQLDNIATLQLPTDRPKQALQTTRGARRYFVFSDALSSELNRLSRQYGATLFMTILAAFQTLLHRYSGQTDVVIGSPVAGRGRREFEDLIGFFLNTLVLRLDLSGNPTFAEAIRRVREVCLGALTHQELPFEKLVEELHPDRNLGHNPLFQVSFVFRNTPRVRPQLTGVTVEELEVETGIARFDLHVFMEEIDGHLRGYCDYDTSLFNADTIERMVGHFKILLEGIVSNPDQRISELPILTEAEKHQLLVEWNDTTIDYPKDKCIHQLFEKQVEKTPEAVAVIFEDQKLTYRELNHRGNQLAHHLQTLGVGPEVLVGICMERSLEMVVGLLGILKAGGAYVPLDPNYPKERMGFMLNDSQTPLLLTQRHLLQGLPAHRAQVLCLDTAWDQITQQCDRNPFPQTRAGNAAYMIYTSGSTGTPKGVVNVHGGLLNRLQWMQEKYCLTPADRVLQKTLFTFDVSVWEFFWPLISGACLVMARPEGHRDSAYLVHLIKSQQITTLHFVPSLLQVFLQAPGIEECISLKHVFCSGEALSHDLEQRFFERSTAALHNLYGPTEASIDVTAWECRKYSNSTTVPIGKPIANTEIYILDSHLNPVPIGVAGELHVGGAGLARGYLNRPELTAEKFIPNPFGAEPQSRLYKTGDLGRYLPDGNIEFLGRIDNQVKIRGYRIELGEIETVLGQHPIVREAVVLAREDSPGDKRLVAYLVGASGSIPSVSELRGFLQQKLPEYMVPSAFLFLDSLPLTPNGKVDRKALPAPDQSRPELEHSYTAPRTPVEELLANIWAEVLKLDKIGIHDNFFQLGGHSLIATQVVSRIRTRLSCDLPLRALFESPTVAELAAEIERAHSHKAAGGDMTVLLAELESLSDQEVNQRLNKNSTSLLKNP